MRVLGSHKNTTISSAYIISALIYTQVSIRQLKAVHTSTHPARPITRRIEVELEEDDSESLFATLAAEAEDEA